MADRVEIYLKGSSNYDASVRLLGDTDTGTIGLPNLRLQILASGAWVDVELDTPAAAAAAAVLWGAIGGTLTDQTDLVAALALKAPLASPALTGNPTAPTQTAANNSTRVATTAYADGAVATEATARSSADATLQPLSSKLTAWAGLTWAANKIGFFTGAAAASVIDFTTFAQGIVILTTAALWRNAIDKGATALTDAASITTDCSVNNFFTVTLTAGGHTLVNPTNMAAGAPYTWAISPATFAMSFGAAFDFGAKGTPTLTTTAGKTDYITGYSPDGTKLHVSFNPGFS